MLRRPVSRLASAGVLTALAATAAIALCDASSASSASSAASAPQPLHAVTVGGVTLDVPVSWHVATSTASGPGCIVATGVTAPATDKTYGVDDCQLRVLTGPQLGSRFASPDQLYYGGQGNPAQCVQGDRDRGWVTAAATDTRVGASQAEYRRFTRACVSRPAEQWFVAGTPAVLIERTSANPVTEAAATSAVEDARVPAAVVGNPRSVTGAPLSASGSTVTLEPVRLSYDDLGAATESYVLDRSLTLDVSHAAIDYTDADGRFRQLTTAQFVAYSAHGFPNIGSGEVPAVIAQSTTGARIDSASVVGVKAPR